MTIRLEPLYHTDLAATSAARAAMTGTVSAIRTTREAIRTAELRQLELGLANGARLMELVASVWSGGDAVT